MGEVETVLEVSRKLLAASPASAPLKGEDSMRGDLYTSVVSIDSDVVLILAALLCGLICVLGLNSLVRCALRCRRRISMVLEDDVAARLVNTGLKKAAIEALPTIIYSNSCKLTDCPICLAEFVEGESLRLLPKCNHGFHVHCIDRWLASHSSCPTCRHCLKKNPSSASVTCNSLPVSVTCSAQPVPVRCSAPPAPVSCSAQAVGPSDVVVVDIIVEEQSAEGRPNVVESVVISSSEHSADADVS